MSGEEASLGICLSTHWEHELSVSRVNLVVCFSPLVPGYPEPPRSSRTTPYDPVPVESLSLACLPSDEEGGASRGIATRVVGRAGPMAGLADIVYPAGLRTWQTLPRRCSSVISLGNEKGCLRPPGTDWHWCFWGLNRSIVCQLGLGVRAC